MTVEQLLSNLNSVEITQWKLYLIIRDEDEQRQIRKQKLQASVKRKGSRRRF